MTTCLVVLILFTELKAQLPEECKLHRLQSPRSIPLYTHRFHVQVEHTAPARCYFAATPVNAKPSVFETCAVKLNTPPCVGKRYFA